MKLKVFNFNSMVTTYYVDLIAVFNCGLEAGFAITVDQFAHDKIDADDIVILGLKTDYIELQRKLPQNWKEQLTKQILETITIDWLLAKRIQYTKKTMTEHRLDAPKSYKPPTIGKTELPDGEQLSAEMQALSIEYESATDIVEFVKNFEDEEHFTKWVRVGNVKDLQGALIKFEKAELWAHCAIIRDTIKERE